MPSLDHRVKCLGFASYDAYLESDHWRDFKERYQKSGASTRCRVCGHPHTQLHHRTYQNVGNEAFGDVVPLCRPHHEAVHTWLKDNKKSLRHTDEAILALKRPIDRSRSRTARPVGPRKGGSSKRPGIRKRMRQEQHEVVKKQLRALSVPELVTRLGRNALTDRQRSAAIRAARANDRGTLIGLLLPFEKKRLPEPVMPWEREEPTLDEMADRKINDPGA